MTGRARSITILTMGSAGFVIDCRVGRLVESRVKALRTVADVDEYARATGRALARVRAPQRAIICADHSAVSVYPPDVADAFVALLAAINPRVECAALLVSAENATIAMQLGRLTTKAGHVSRRVFREREACVAHLGPLLDDAERRRLDDFLGEA